MRIKTYIADDMPEALAMIRAELGDDAIIVSTETRQDRTIKVIAACETQETAASDRPVIESAKPPDRGAPVDQAIAAALAAHGAPEMLVRQFAAGAQDHQDLTPEMALAALCRERLLFGGAPFRPSLRPIVLVGPPGAGKTTTAAKLAAHAMVNGAAVDLMGADGIKTGATEQLAGLAKHMHLNIETADNSAALTAGWRARRARHEAAGRDVLAIVDTTGANPFDQDDLDRTATLIAGVRGHGVLVLPAGGDPLEAADTAIAFAEAGVTHLIVTRIDAARRLGGMLAAAAVRSNNLQLKLAGVGIAPRIGNGLRPVTPVSLARLLVTRTQDGSQHMWNDGTQEECA